MINCYTGKSRGRIVIKVPNTSIMMNLNTRSPWQDLCINYDLSINIMNNIHRVKITLPVYTNTCIPPFYHHPPPQCYPTFCHHPSPILPPPPFYYHPLPHSNSPPPILPPPIFTVYNVWQLTSMPLYHLLHNIFSMLQILRKQERHLRRSHFTETNISRIEECCWHFNHLHTPVTWGLHLPTARCLAIKIKSEKKSPQILKKPLLNDLYIYLIFLWHYSLWDSNTAGRKTLKLSIPDPLSGMAWSSITNLYFLS